MVIKAKATRKMMEAARERIRELEEEHGHVTPDMVIEEARDPASPLHSCFEWDIEKAALAHWREQARELIASVRYTYTVQDVEYSAPAFVHDPSLPSGEQGYISVPRLKSNKDLAREALVEEFSRAAAALRRAYELASALAFETAEVKKLEKKVGVLLKKAEAGASGTA